MLQCSAGGATVTSRLQWLGGLCCDGGVIETGLSQFLGVTVTGNYCDGGVAVTGRCIDRGRRWSDGATQLRWVTVTEALQWWSVTSTSDTVIECFSDGEVQWLGITVMKALQSRSVKTTEKMQWRGLYSDLCVTVTETLPSQGRWSDGDVTLTGALQ